MMKAGFTFPMVQSCFRVQLPIVGRIQPTCTAGVLGLLWIFYFSYLTSQSPSWVNLTEKFIGSAKAAFSKRSSKRSVLAEASLRDLTLKLDLHWIKQT